MDLCENLKPGDIDPTGWQCAYARLGTYLAYTLAYTILYLAKGICQTEGAGGQMAYAVQS